MEIPARIFGHCTSIKADVVSKDIPLLLSKKAMKDAKVNIDFVNNKIEIFGIDLDIFCSTSGHYCIPIFSFKHIGNENKNEVLPSINDMNSKEEKTQRCKEFTQAAWTPHTSKTIELLNDANINDKELCVIIEEITKECEVCLKYPPPPKNKQIRPTVSFPLAIEFNECVAMYLEQWSCQNKVCLIHIVDHLTRFSTSCVIQSKRRGYRREYF